MANRQFDGQLHQYHATTKVNDSGQGVLKQLTLKVKELRDYSKTAC